MPLVLLRIALYLQLLLGLALFFGSMLGLGFTRGFGEIHLGLGILIAILAIVALRPLPAVPGTGLRAAARFFPLVPLALGLGFYFQVIGGQPLVIVHMLAGIIAIGLVEVAAARQRRAMLAGVPPARS